jgi:hypothetical protein
LSFIEEVIGRYGGLGDDYGAYQSSPKEASSKKDGMIVLSSFTYVMVAAVVTVAVAGIYPLHHTVASPYPE